MATKELKEYEMKMEDLFKELKPKKVFVAVEFAGLDDTEASTERVKLALAKVCGDRTDIKVTACGVISVPVEEGHAQILPKFSFVDKKVTWAKTKKSDLSLVFRLNGDLLVIEAKGVQPYTVLV